MQKTLEFLKRQKLSIKILVIFIFLIIVVGAYLTLAYCSGSLLKTLRRSELSVFYYAFKDPSGRAITTMLYVVATFIIFYSVAFVFKHNNVSDKDERGVHFMEQSTYGSSRWMRKDEVANSFEVNKIKNTTTTIYGQLSNNGKKVVGYKKPLKGGTGNRNTICIASMGAGKSFGYVRTELIQAVLRGDSFVVTDPSAELYTDLAQFCMDKGLDVKVLNLAEPDYSDFWNCLEETIDPETERLDPTRLNDFAAIYMQNSGDGDNDFWYNSALNLLKATIAYTAWQKENPIIEGYEHLYTTITGEVSGYFFDETRNSMTSFPWCRQEILNAAQVHGQNIEKTKLAIHEIETTYGKDYTIERVFYNLWHFTNIESNFEVIKEWHPARLYYLVYATNNTENVRKSALQGIQLRFSIFQDRKIREIVSHDGIKLSEANQRQSAYFVIMSDKTNTLKPIASLFFSFLFKDAQDIFDRKAQIAKANNKPNPCLNLVTMLDEFYSIGQIGGSADAFGITMSNSRKRNIFISVIIQAYSQLEAVYGPQVKDIIQGGCSTLLYLGGNDPETCKFISEFASGESTVLSESHDEFGLLHRNDLKLKVRTDKRFLLTVDEARRWKNAVLVVKQGEYPLKLNPFPWIEHPCFLSGETKPTAIYKNIQKLDDRLTNIKIANAKKSASNTNNMIQSFVEIKKVDEPELIKEVVEKLKPIKLPPTNKKQKHQSTLNI